ncbi:hypothetical protein SAMN05216535_0159 [Stutzerimonas xanthomarina]|uniref:Uncharacterized protein n=2 Tax=Stutzerimonas xanthomarina TaxID=271420 RepID=A0A1M5L4S0_9GAMM|nr:hypothetical protein SAMN05216535_0159 [Stutzerimonas xanthomarina]SHG60104.1 hypothetical protein SAMN02744645_0861 [Stutzerimonas xanthomarina DSM 18231]
MQACLPVAMEDFAMEATPLKTDPANPCRICISPVLMHHER